MNDPLVEKYNLNLKQATDLINQKRNNEALPYLKACLEALYTLAQNSYDPKKKQNYLEIAGKIRPTYDKIKNDQQTVTSNSGEKTKEKDQHTKIEKADEPVPEITVEEALEELNALTGLQEVKDEVTKFVNKIKIDQIRQQQGIKVSAATYHLVFKGNPGTGKTTVARIMCKIFKALGISKKGQLIETSRKDLVAGYVGQTAIKTKEVIESAYDGILFIDEAYELVEGGANDFGKEAINTLLAEMENNRDKLIVIAAGYDQDMDKFIAANPGLQSRFKNIVHFKDYTEEELYQIFLSNCKKNEYVLNEEAQAKLKEYIHHLYSNKDEQFGNARVIRNLFEDLTLAQSMRLSLITDHELTKDDLITITAEDIEKL